EPHAAARTTSAITQVRMRASYALFALWRDRTDLVGPLTKCVEDHTYERERNQEHPAHEARRDAEVGECEEHADRPHEHRHEIAGDQDLALADRALELLEKKRSFLG